jgi:ketosteroid isomerase-like protein
MRGNPWPVSPKCAPSVDHFGIDGDTVFIHWIFDMVAKDGSIRRLDEIAMQQWRGDRIFRERFYYDPAVFNA